MNRIDTEFPRSSGLKDQLVAMYHRWLIPLASRQLGSGLGSQDSNALDLPDGFEAMNAADLTPNDLYTMGAILLEHPRKYWAVYLLAGIRPGELKTALDFVHRNNGGADAYDIR